MWTFEVLTDGDISATLTVHRYTGHWSRLFDFETATPGAGVYVYEATIHAVDGSERYTCLTRNDMLRLRRAAKKATN